MKDENKVLKQKIEEQEQRIFKLQLEQVKSPAKPDPPAAPKPGLHYQRAVTSSNPTL